LMYFSIYFVKHYDKSGIDRFIHEMLLREPNVELRDRENLTVFDHLINISTCHFNSSSHKAAKEFMTILLKYSCNHMSSYTQEFRQIVLLYGYNYGDDQTFSELLSQCEQLEINNELLFISIIEGDINTKLTGFLAKNLVVSDHIYKKSMLELIDDRSYHKIYLLLKHISNMNPYAIYITRFNGITSNLGEHIENAISAVKYSPFDDEDEDEDYLVYRASIITELIYSRRRSFLCLIYGTNTDNDDNSSYISNYLFNDLIVQQVTQFMEQPTLVLHDSDSD